MLLCIYIIPFFFADKFWSIVNSLDVMQNIYILSFINPRVPINQISFNKSIKIFQNFMLPGLIDYTYEITGIYSFNIQKFEIS